MPDGDLTGIAWNTASDTPMFATGSLDGAVTIWTSPLEQPRIIMSHSTSGEASRTDSPTPMTPILPDGSMRQEFEPTSDEPSRREQDLERRTSISFVPPDILAGDLGN